MMFLLVNDIIYYSISLRTRIRKCSVTRLPLKSSFHKIVFVYPFRRSCFEHSHKVRYFSIRMLLEEDMNMIQPSSDRQRKGIIILQNTVHISVQIVTK